MNCLAPADALQPSVLGISSTYVFILHIPPPGNLGYDCKDKLIPKEYILPDKDA